MEIKIGPKSEPCGTPPVMWVAVLISDPDNEAMFQDLFHSRVGIHEF